MKIREDGTISHGGKIETYDEFVNKFKPKHTTDDCNTPPEVYNLIADYVSKTFNVSRETFVRPFYPGNDYKQFDYTGKIVVDNPPFSISSDICEWYQNNNIKFFLFCNGLTAMNIRHAGDYGYVFINKPIKYENGAKIKTAFVTNLCNYIIIEPDLIPKKPKRKAKYREPGVLTSADLTTIDEHRIITDYEVHRDKKYYGGYIKLKGSEHADN